MPNKIKYNSGIDTNALNIGDWSVGAELGMGPTLSTEFKNGLEIPVGGYIIYHGATIRGVVVNDDTELIESLNKLGASIQKEDIGGALSWAKANSVLVLNHFYDNVITEGLVLNVEPNHIACFADNKPVTNVVTNTNLDTGWAKGYQRDIVFNDGPGPVGVDSPVVGFNRGQSSGYWYSYGDYAPQTPGETYVVSVWVKTNDPSFNLNYYTANNSEAGRKWGPHIGVPGDGQWHRIEWPSFVNSATSQSDSLSFNFNFSQPIGDDTSRVWLCAPMMHTGTEHVPFVAGTRAQNNLIDLSGKSTEGIVLGNPKQDAQGNLVLDGAGDHLQFNSHSAFNVDARTIEIKFKMNSSYPNFAPLAVYANGSSSTNRMWLGIQNNKFQMHGWGTDDPTGTTTINAGEWYTCVFSYDKSSQQMKVYTNGKLESTRTNSQGGISAVAGMNWYVGAVPGSWNSVTYSDMTLASFKVYDRILSDEEVAQNYYRASIVKDGLVFNTDASNIQSYIPGDTTTKSLVDGTVGTLVNGVGYSNENNGVWTFDGVDDYITLNNPLTVTQPYTILMWLKPDVLGTGASSANRSTPLKGNGHWNPGIWVTQDMIRSHGDTRYVDSYIDWSGLEYAQIGMIFDGTTVYNIFNGQILPNFLSNSYNPGVPSEILIGAENTGGLNVWDGSISNTICYQRALSQDEVLQNYNATAARFK